MEIDLNHLLASAKSVEEVESLLVGVLNEATRAGNVIIFIDEIERILTQNEAGTIAAGRILESYLQNPNFYLIGTTDYKSYHLAVETSPAMRGLAEKIEVPEPDEKETIKILIETAPYIESRNHILMTYPVIKEAVNLSARFIPNQKFPEKAIDLLDKVAVYASKRGTKVVNISDVDEVVSSQTGIPTGEAEKGEKEKLLNLEEIMHRRLVNQQEAVKVIAQAMQRSRAGVGKINKPVGSFLFFGPTGVGKTECAKTLAEAYFGNEKNMLRFDMSEFQTVESINRLIGSDTTPYGLLTSLVKERPFSLLLLDEIEKAHPDILNLFLQVFDEGTLTSASGEKIDFKNCIIIATSNAGAEYIREKLVEGKLPENFREEFLNFILQKGIFKPEFINRFDAVVAFRPLTEAELIQVAEIMLNKLNERLKDKNIIVQLEEGAKLKLAKLGFDPQFGARALNRIMQEKIENLVAQKILKGELQKGQGLTVTEEMI